MQLHGMTLSKLLAVLVLSTAAIGSGQNNDQPKRSAVEQDTNEQLAVNQLRAIVEAIKRCPKVKSPDKLGAYFYSAPQVAEWDVIPKQSARSDWLGYIEFTVRREYVPNALPECKKKNSKCQWDNWEISQMNSILEGVNPPDEQRYEFDIGTHGLEFYRSMMKHQSDDETHWTGIESSPDKTCEGDAITIVLNNRPPQIPDTLWQAAKNGEPEAESMGKVPPPSAAPSSPAQPSANTESAPPAESIATLKERAAIGDPNAQWNLYLKYEDEDGVLHDEVLAMVWLHKAAENGNSSAQCELGAAYQLGQGVSQDYVQAASWFRTAAGQGDVDAQTFLGDLYANGNGVTRDYEQAAYWYLKAAKQGDAKAQGELGSDYALGQGVPQDYSEAYFWLDLAAAGAPARVKPEDTAKARDLVIKTRDLCASLLTPADLSREQERARKWFEDHPAKQ